MQELLQNERDKRRNGEVMFEGVEVIEVDGADLNQFEDSQLPEDGADRFEDVILLRRELSEIRELLSIEA
jgi:hypothetical protein